MTQPIHTPGPVELISSGTAIIRRTPKGNEFIALMNSASAEPQMCKEETIKANARLLAAAYNAFHFAAERLGLNAIEMAERMQDGALLAEILDNADRILHHTPYLDKTAFAQVATILSKVKGQTG